MTMKKLLVLSLIILLAFTLLLGCEGEQAQEPEEQAQDQTPAGEEEEEENDVTTTASIVSKEADFKKAISEDGTWIIAIINDMKFEEELVVEGEFRDKGNPDNELYRKLAFYAQDENYNVTERYTVTAPKMTIRSPNTKIQGGTFVGDVYVEANGFTIEDGKVDGNVYFANEEYESSFELAEKGEVTGETTVQ